MAQNKLSGESQMKLGIFGVVIFILINIISAFPFILILFIIGFVKFGLSVDKILKIFGIPEVIKELFGTDYYEKFVHNNKTQQGGDQNIEGGGKTQDIGDLYDSEEDKVYRKIDYSSVESTIENNRQIEEQREEIKIREKNKLLLKSKLSNKKVISKYSQDVHEKSDIISNKYGNKLIGNDHSASHKYASDFARKSQKITTNNNYFGNTKQTTSFGNGKSIWDNYESVTDKFSSKN